ncbi:hypothetical protein Tco_0366426 [Tanacetum coccineum]
MSWLLTLFGLRCRGRLATFSLYVECIGKWHICWFRFLIFASFGVFWAIVLDFSCLLGLSSEGGLQVGMASGMMSVKVHEVVFGLLRVVGCGAIARTSMLSYFSVIGHGCDERSRFSKTTCATCWLVHSWCYVEEECYLVDPASSHMLVSKIKPCMFKKLVVGLWVGSAGPPYGVHRFTRPFCRRCAPGLNWLGRASGAVTLKKLECSKQAYALRTTAKAFAKDVFINQERKLGARRRSDTVLVSTINDADQGSADVAYGTPLAPYEKSKFLGSGGEYGCKAET